ncbi:MULTISPECIES: hypothetical protein [Methylobacterium]|uniref:hypothetical protein n=1 Tax=Methylobacterium TaxID=407 RepID=UPI00272E2D55|nr:hypothetical protein [Methylobacterium sp.]
MRPTAPILSRPARRLEQADRERIADALHAAGATPVVHARIAAPYDEYPHPELDLVIQADWRSTRPIKEAWVNWALENDLDLDGKIEVRLLYTHALPEGRKRREREGLSGLQVDLAQVLLERDLAALDADDRALGLAI